MAALLETFRYRDRFGGRGRGAARTGWSFCELFCGSFRVLLHLEMFEVVGMIFWELQTGVGQTGEGLSM